MLSSIIAGLLAKLWPFIAGAVGFLAVVAGAFFKGKSRAKADIAAKVAKDTAKRTEAGRKAQGKADADLRSGKTPDDVVSSGDKKWRK